MATKKLTKAQYAELIEILQQRFTNHPERHKSLKWKKVVAKLESQPKKARSLYQMETTGGEPDLIAYDKKSDTYLFVDCSEQTPAGRRSLCYDDKALAARAKNKPTGSALAMAKNMGIDLLDKHWYKKLQKLGSFDTKTSSWLETPDAIRQHGGAIFGDCRYEHVFTYHNGADSYYAARGFRGMLWI